MQNRLFNTQKEKSVPINWRRGMFRLWILASIAWIMGWIILFIIQFLLGEAPTPQLAVAPVILFAPPIALLLFGLATRWAFQGFQADDGPTGG
jgi:hypothetical protein